MRDQHAHCAPCLALLADGVSWNHRLAAIESGCDHFEKLVAIDRAPAKLEVDRHMISDPRRLRERADVLRVGVDRRREVTDVGVIAQCLNAARGRASADGHEHPRRLAYQSNALRIVRGRDRAFDEGHVVRSFHDSAGQLLELQDLHRADDP